MQQLEAAKMTLQRRGLEQEELLLQQHVALQNEVTAAKQEVLDEMNSVAVQSRASTALNQELHTEQTAFRRHLEAESAGSQHLVAVLRSELHAAADREHELC